MIKIYHNPRCSKSREGLQILEDSNKPFTVIKYMDESLNKKQLESVILLLGIKPIDLVRKSEAVWKEHYKDKPLTDNQVVMAMVKYPKLIERPIVVNGKKAVIGRPATKILDII